MDGIFLYLRSQNFRFIYRSLGAVKSKNALFRIALCFVNNYILANNYVEDVFEYNNKAKHRFLDNFATAIRIDIETL